MPHLSAARAGLLIFRQIVDELLSRQIRRQSPPTVPVGRGTWRGCRLGQRFRNGRRRGQLIQQHLEQQHLLGIDLLRRAAELPTQQLLQLMLKTVDLAALLLQLFEELRPLSAKKFDFLSKLREFPLRYGATVRGHAL
jgi:hypothetical protein